MLEPRVWKVMAELAIARADLMSPAPAPQEQSVNLTLVVGPVLAAKCLLVDLPGWGFRQFLHDMDRLGYLVRSFLLAHGFFDLIPVDLFAWAHGDECGDGLAPFIVGNADDRDRGHAGAGGDYVLDLARVHVERARDDDVFLPVDQVEEALLVADGEIAGVQPATFERRGGQLGLVAVAGHNHPGAQAHLTDFPVRHGRPFVAEDLGPDAGDRAAAGGEQAWPPYRGARGLAQGAP